MRRAGCILVVLAQLVEAQEPRVIVGGDEERSTALGRVIQVALLPSGFVVLEGSAPHLRYFDTTGRLRQTVGRAGGGPGEYRSPFSVRFEASETRLSVVDPQNARLTEYEVRDSLSLRETLQIDVPMARAVCRVGGRLVALAGTDSMVLRELVRRDDRLVEARRFGRRESSHPLARHPMLAARIGSGPLECASDLQHVYVASATLGEVLLQPLESGGRGRWLAIPGFRPVVIRAVENGGLQFAYGESGPYERIVDVRATPSGLQVVVERREVRGGEETTVGYRLVEVGSDGRMLGTRTVRWRPLGALSGREYCFREEPVPTIGVMDRGACP